MLKVEVATENAAFSDHAGQELARILRKLADTLAADIRIAPMGNGEWITEAGTLRDVNGNTVGWWSLTEQEATR